MEGQRFLGTQWERHGGLRKGGVELASKIGWVLRKKGREGMGPEHS